MQRKAKQSESKRSKELQSNTLQSKQSTAMQSNSKQRNAKQGNANQSKAKQRKATQRNAKRSDVKQNNTMQGKTMLGRWRRAVGGVRLAPPFVLKKESPVSMFKFVSSDERQNVHPVKSVRRKPAQTATLDSPPGSAFWIHSGFI